MSKGRLRAEARRSWVLEHAFQFRGQLLDDAAGGHTDGLAGITQGVLDDGAISQPGQQTTIDDESLAGDEASLVAGQEGDGISHVLWLAETIEWA